MFDFAANEQENGETREILEGPNKDWSDVGHSGSATAEDMIKDSFVTMANIVRSWGGYIDINRMNLANLVEWE